MSMLLTDAQTYVARVIAGQDDPNLYAAALDSIRATYLKWGRDHDWTFLLQDNSQATSIASCVIAGDGVTVTNATAGALFGVNIGQTVTGTGVPANTTISAVTETNGQGVTAFTLSAASTPGTVTLTFGAYIPLAGSTQEYNLPSNFYKPYSARLNSNARTLVYFRLREIDRKVARQDRLGIPTHYSIYNIHVFDSTAQHHHLRLYPIPSPTSTTGESVFLKYYRAFNIASTVIDIPDDFLYAFLDDARVHLMQMKSEDDPRLPILLQSALKGFSSAVDQDEQESEDEDLRWMSQQEAGEQNYVDFDLWSYWDR
jgi:hypothetical protein